MNTPSCRNCRTDDYLRFLEYTPARPYTLKLRSHQGEMTRERTDPPVADYFCRKCGLRDGRSVAMDWEQPEETATDDAVLDEFGKVYIRPGAYKDREGTIRA